MRMPSLTSMLLLLCLNGCSQNDHHNFNDPRKIPIDAERWYQLNNTAHGLEQLFNGKQYERPNTGHGLVLTNYDAYYPVLEGEQITIDSIAFFDWEGANEEHPLTVYVILHDWKRVPIASFTGMRYNAWNGPDPKKPDALALATSVRNIRYIVINSWGDFPGELEFYGSYTPPKTVVAAPLNYAPLKNFFGVNAFEWDFVNPADALNPDSTRLKAIKNFTGIRHYLDWEKLENTEGRYTFNPSVNGLWNYDTMYHWCRAQGVEVVACIKTVPEWMQAGTPAGEAGGENVPVRYGKDRSDPASYIEQARLGFQFAARYGGNKNIDRSLVKVDDVMEPWPGGPKNKVRIGLGFISFIECDNERDKWWQGRKAYQTGREYAANLSAFYDGHKNTMGPGVGIKNADPAMKVVMAGLAGPTTDYVRGMIDWSIEFRGRKPDGSVDLPWDIINYHHYANDAGYDPGKKQTTGIAPELSAAAAIATDFVQLANRQVAGMPVWVTETGYDINPESPQKAIAIKSKSALHTQADWILRTSLLYARSGVQKVFFYELVDDNTNSPAIYGTSGLINVNRTNRPAADFLRQTQILFGNFTYDKTLATDPQVDKYTFNDDVMYMLVVPDQKGKTITYTLDLNGADYAFIYAPKAGLANMELEKRKTTNGKIGITVTETPVFITGASLEK